MKLLFDDGDEHVSGHGAVRAVAEEVLDAQVLLDPFEEQFDLPATLVERGDRQRWQCRVVGQEDERAISSPKCNSHFSGWMLRVDGLL